MILTTNEREKSIMYLNKYIDNKSESELIENKIHLYVNNNCYKKLFIETYWDKIYNFINDYNNCEELLKNKTLTYDDIITNNRVKINKIWKNIQNKINVIDEKKNALPTSDFYTCKRCKEKKCFVYQSQTRSADEPMTCFIKCTECGNVLKM